MSVKFKSYVHIVENTIPVQLIFLILVSCVFVPSWVWARDKYTRNINYYTYNLKNKTVIGKPRSHIVQADDSFLDIARKYELGYSEMTSLYPQIDPWMPPADKNLTIPLLWVLPPTKFEQIVINIPEMRLYSFEKETSQVQTYPVGIGCEGWETPEGNFFISEKRSNPKWYIPKSLQKKYGMTIMPHGPDNPLGKYIMKFSNTAYSIHGTNIPWGVGRLISHGCIRCYPEHISLIYPQVKLGTKIEVIYEPIKFGLLENRIFVEIHPDAYGKIPDFIQYSIDKLKNYKPADQVDTALYNQAVLLQNGLPTDVSLTSNNISRYSAEIELSPAEGKTHSGCNNKNL